MGRVTGVTGVNRITHAPRAFTAAPKSVPANAALK